MADKRNERQWRIAQEQGLILHQLSKRKYVVLNVAGFQVVTFKDGNERVVQSTRVMFGPDTWKKCMAFLSKQVSPLPHYLKNN